VLLAMMATLAVALTECISNSAAVAVLLPIGFSLGETTGVDPLTMTLTVTIGSGLAFLLPISSPPNAISFASGHYTVREVVRFGWPMTLCALVVLVGVMIFWWPVLGFSGKMGGP
jgi:sodium-dependent dicarboxylate transporter 2/3/5